MGWREESQQDNDRSVRQGDAPSAPSGGLPKATRSAGGRLLLGLGTYYLMVDTWPPLDCLGNLTLTITACPTGACCTATPDCFVTYEDTCLAAAGALDCQPNGIPDDCAPIQAGDFDGDGFDELDGFEAFSDCMAGPGNTPAPTSSHCAEACRRAFDFDSNDDVDLGDFAGFQGVLDIP